MAITILDGPVGTELNARGLDTPAPLWSAAALRDRPDLVAQIHRDYATAGAHVHTANTFRTTRRAAGESYRELVDIAVQLARSAMQPGSRLAGSIAPLEDCYRPDLSPADPGPEHASLATALAPGCDLLLCETFPHVGEALAAIEAALATGREVWASFTPGYLADLMTPAEVGAAARRAAQLGATAVLVNCVPAVRTLDYVRAIADSGIAADGVAFGAYANAGHPTDGLGWESTDAAAGGAARYADLAATWIDAGATIIGSCCGTSPAATAELVRRFGGSAPR
ncbi:MAG: homocysteine S-methyltransferase family protein [Planctomycetota bacterium]